MRMQIKAALKALEALGFSVTKEVGVYRASKEGVLNDIWVHPYAEEDIEVAVAYIEVIASEARLKAKEIWGRAWFKPIKCRTVKHAVDIAIHTIHKPVVVRP